MGGLFGGGKKSEAPAPMPMPEPPKVEKVADEAIDSAKRRRKAATKTIFTNPLGVAGQADVARKTLTGQ